MLTSIVKLTLKLINTGAEDEKIKEEYLKAQSKGRKGKGIEYILSLLLCLILCAVFAFSVFVGVSGNSFSDTIPTLKVVNSASMSKKHEKNTYLVQNNINDHIQTFDLIFTYKAPGEFELKQYDIVVYEVDDTLIVHRIVNIEEPNKTHPNERWFLCQGDAVENPDRFPVRYSQIKGIYRGERIPFIGSFVSFMQSPAGWLCILLVVATTILTPILEKIIAKARYARYLLICGGQAPVQELAVTEMVKQDVIEKASSPFDRLKGKRDTRDFKQKLAESTDVVKSRYETVDDTLRRIVGARIIEGKKQHSYKTGNIPVARLNFRGKTLNAYLGLNPEEFKDSKYIFTDESGVKAHSNYPMRLKLSSDRQARWATELIQTLCAKHGIALLEKPQEIEVVSEVSPFAHLKGKRDQRTFKERLELSSDTVKARYQDITELLCRIDGVRVIDAKKTETFKKGNVPIAKLMLKGKTLNVYLGLDPKEYTESKYNYLDVSEIKTHENYPMRLKLSSDRQVRWSKELVNELCDKRGLKILKINPFAHLLGRRDDRTFDQKIDTLPVAKTRYEEIVSFINSLGGVRLIEGKKSKTYKLGNRPVVRFTLRGKTLNAFIGLNPKEYIDSKYIFTDVSKTSAYANYPMRVKVSSDRQTRWVKELISAVVLGVGYED